MICNSHLSTPILILFARQFWLLCRALRKSADQKLTWCISTCHPKSNYTDYMCDRFFEEYENGIHTEIHMSFSLLELTNRCEMLWCCRSVVEVSPSKDVDGDTSSLLTALCLHRRRFPHTYFDIGPLGSNKNDEQEGTDVYKLKSSYRSKDKLAKLFSDMSSFGNVNVKLGIISRILARSVHVM